MTNKKAAAILRQYNAWRAHKAKYPKGLDEALDTAIETLELASENLLPVEDLQKFVSDDKRVLTEIYDHIREYLEKD